MMNFWRIYDDLLETKEQLEIVIDWRILLKCFKETSLKVGNYSSFSLLVSVSRSWTSKKLIFGFT